MVAYYCFGALQAISYGPKNADYTKFNWSKYLDEPRKRVEYLGKIGFNLSPSDTAVLLKDDASKEGI